MGRRNEEIIHVTPSARNAIREYRSSWGWRSGLRVVICRFEGAGFQFRVPEPDMGPLVEFTSAGLRLAVRADEMDCFRGSVLSRNFDALYGKAIWSLSCPNVSWLPSPCSDPLGASCCSLKFRRLHAELFGWRGLLDRVFGGLSQEDREQLIARTSEYLRIGDGRAAVVLQTAPLVVAAYCDETDAAILLRFPDFLAEERALNAGDRLVTANLQRPFADGPLACDIRLGPRASGRFGNVRPLVADFLAREEECVEARRRAISSAEYERCWQLGQQGLRGGQPFRSGRPLEAGKAGPPWTHAE